MNLVQKIHALDAEVVVLGSHHVRVVLELLDVDHRDFRPAAVVVHHLRGIDVAAERITAVNGVHYQPTTRELALRLGEQINPVNDEVKLWDHPFALEVISEKTGVVVSQRGFAAALGVPDDALFDPCFELFLYGFGGKELRIAHDVLVQAVTFIDVSHCKPEQEGKSVAAE